MLAIAPVLQRSVQTFERIERQLLKYYQMCFGLRVYLLVYAKDIS